MEHLTPPIPLMLDRLRTVRLPNRALFRAERELSTLWGHKISLYRLLASDQLGLNDLSILLWLGLLHEDPKLTLEQTQEIMDLARLPEIITVILQAWNATTMPAEPRQESPDAPFPNGLIGAASGAMPESS